jgi:hypothetical protein
MKKSFLLTTIFLFSLSVVHAASWTNPITPLQCFAGYSDGKVIITGFDQSQGCESSAVVFDASNSDPDHILSMCLTTFSSGKKILCFVDGCSGSYQKGSACQTIH